MIYRKSKVHSYYIVYFVCVCVWGGGGGGVRQLSGSEGWAYLCVAREGGGGRYSNNNSGNPFSTETICLNNKEIKK